MRVRGNAACIALLGLVLGLAPGAWATTYMYSSIDVPTALDTEAGGINDSGQLVGTYDVGVPGGIVSHGFLDNGGSFTPIDVPGALGDTFATGINDSGQIVGGYADASGEHGFLGTPVSGVVTPEPASLVLLGSGLAGLASWRSWRQMKRA